MSIFSLSNRIMAGLAIYFLTMNIASAAPAGASTTKSNLTIIDDESTAVCTLADLQNVRNNLAGKYVQTCNIDMASVSSWKAIGDRNTPETETGYPERNFDAFTGSFNGNGKTISNLNSPTGLFAHIKGSVSRVNFVAANIYNNPSIKIYGKVGVLARQNSGAIDNIKVSGKIQASNMNYVGTLVGFNEGTIKNSSSSATVLDVSGAFTNSALLNNGIKGLGGLVGYNSSVISDSFFSGVINGGSADVGGLVGSQYTSTTAYTTQPPKLAKTIRSYSSGSIVSNATAYSVGGLIGTAGGTASYLFPVVQDSNFTGTVKGGTNVGGIIGLANGSNFQILNSFSKGNITATNTEVGGMVGRSQNLTTVEHSYSKAVVTSESGSAAGIVGNAFNGGVTISNSYFAGTVDSRSVSAGFIATATGLAKDRRPSSFINSYSSGVLRGNVLGGLLPTALHNYNGNGMFNDSNCYWDIETSGTTSSTIGVGLPTSQMIAQASYQNWDFVMTWMMLAGKNPQLR
ncbi:MAG: hypothetical protein J0L93_09230 [Deltaproteobacteria bacterium]|nr:hypothetical protein [Deltaproteobacteria bacterium]